MKEFTFNETTGGVLITVYTKNGENPYCFVINDKEATIPQTKGSIAYYRYNINCFGKTDVKTNYVYLISYTQDPGGIFVPVCCYAENSDAENFLKYWNDDAGIMATGKYYLKTKVKLLK